MFDGLRTRLKMLTSAPPQPGSASGAYGLGSYLVLPERRFAWSKDVGDGSGSGIVMSPANWIGRTFAEAPLVVTKPDEDGDREPVDGHPLPALIEHPNEFYDGFTLWHATLVAWCTRGNAYWIKVRNSAGTPVELWFAPNWTMNPRWSSQTGAAFVDHYDYSPSGFPIRLEPEDVVHLRHGIDPHNVRLGRAPIAEILREVFTDDEASRYTAAILRNLGVPGLIVAPASEAANVTDEDAQAIKAKLDERLVGENRGKALVLTGKTSVTQFGFSPRDMDVSNLRDVSEERVCAAFGLPAAVVGYGSGLQTTKVGATMREMVGLAWSGCLIPYQRIMASQLAHQLLSDFETDPRARIDFDRSNVVALQEDAGALSTRLGDQLRAGGITRAEYRRKLGYEADPAGADDVYLMPLSVIEVRLGEDALPAPVPAPVPPPKGRVARLRLVKGQRGTAPQRRLIFRLVRGARRLEPVFAKELHAFFRDLGAAAAAAAQRVLLKRGKAKRATKDVVPLLPPGSMPPPGGTPAVTLDDLVLRADVQDMISEMGVTAAFARLQEIYGGHYLRTATDTQAAINDTIGLGVQLPDEMARSIVAAGGRRVGLVDLTAQTRENLFEALAEGRSLGEGVDDLVSRIRDEVPAGPWADAETRARVVARTETLHAQRSSALSFYAAAENVSEVMLFDNLTGYDDDDCSARDGQIVSFEEAQQAMEDEHPNGTLGFAPVVGESVRLAAEAEAEGEA